MKRFLSFFIVAVIMQICTVSCGQVSVRIIESQISKIHAAGFGSVDVGFNLNIKSDSPKIDVEDFRGSILWKGSVICNFEIQPFVIEGRSTSWHEVNGTIALDRGFSPVSAILMFRENDPSQYSISFEATCRMGVVKKKISQKQIPLKSIL